MLVVYKPSTQGPDYNLSFGRRPEYFLFGDYDIEIVFRVNNTNARVQPLVCFGFSSESPQGNNLYAIGFGADGKFTINHEYGGGAEITRTESGASLKKGSWQRVRVVRSGLSYRGYVDGVLVIDQTFNANQKPTVFDITTAYHQLWLGFWWYAADSYVAADDLTLAYVNIKNETGTTVFSLGSDPGGAGVPNPPTLKGNESMDPYTNQTRSNRISGVTKGTSTILSGFSRNTLRPVQYNKGRVDLDAFYGTVERGSQKNLGLILEPNKSTDDQGSGKINKPRAYPLEMSWKKANPTSF